MMIVTADMAKANHARVGSKGGLGLIKQDKMTVQ